MIGDGGGDGLIVTISQSQSLNSTFGEAKHGVCEA